MPTMIAIESKEDMVTCTSCRHFKLGLANRLLGGQQFAKCGRTEEVSMTYDPVTGKTVEKSKIDYCSTARGDYKGHANECGPQGRHWVPKHTRDVFKALKRS